MNKDNDRTRGEQNQQPGEDEQTPKSRKKRPFVEPAISVPVDVLEATTFFQAPTIEAANIG